MSGIARRGAVHRDNVKRLPFSQGFLHIPLHVDFQPGIVQTRNRVAHRSRAEIIGRRDMQLEHRVRSRIRREGKILGNRQVITGQIKRALGQALTRLSLFAGDINYFGGEEVRVPNVLGYGF